ncbi:hypothetical protein [Clostridium niameyense]|nr:hypothetical protein [Clostridium niameyense]
MIIFQEITREVQNLIKTKDYILCNLAYTTSLVIDSINKNM